MRVLYKYGLLSFISLSVWLTGTGAFAGSVAVFPLQELGVERNEVNLPLTRLLTDRLVTAGNKVVSLKTVFAFMANNRIRTLGHLESYDISRVRSDLGATFILLGTVSQRRELPEPALGLTLNLIRTSDGRTVWTYVDSLSSSDERRILGVGEPRSVSDLQPLLLAELMAQWPWPIINEVQRGGASLYLDQSRLEPRGLRPGETVRGQVRLRNIWTPGQVPQVFFRADDQLYPATMAADGLTWEGKWVVGNKDGSYPVTLLLEWPLYDRTESALMGSYVVDGTPPLFEIELRGAQQFEGRPIFSRQIVIVPRPLVRKQLSRWQLSFYAEEGTLVGSMEEEGQLPESLVWSGQTTNNMMIEDGLFRCVLEAWDLAGNKARAEQWLELNRSRPDVTMAIDNGSDKVSVNLMQEGKVPLEFWRMEMWNREGRILARQEGAKLPVNIDLDLAGVALSDDIQGFVVIQDILGNRVRRTIEELLPDLGKVEVEEQVEEATDISQKWVDEF